MRFLIEILVCVILSVLRIATLEFDYEHNRRSTKTLE